MENVTSCDVFAPEMRILKVAPEKGHYHRETEAALQFIHTF